MINKVLHIIAYSSARFPVILLAVSDKFRPALFAFGSRQRDVQPIVFTEGQLHISCWNEAPC